MWEDHRTFSLTKIKWLMNRLRAEAEGRIYIYIRINNMPISLDNLRIELFYRLLCVWEGTGGGGGGVTHISEQR